MDIIFDFDRLIILTYSKYYYYKLSPMTNIENLHKTFKQFGALALTYRQKCIGMLPEINRLRVYEKKGYGSIYEYAAKLAGISREQVQRVLQLDHKFEDKPALKNMLIKGEISVNKLARIASVATVENQNLWADQIKNLSQKTVETLVKDYKNGANPNTEPENQNGLFEANYEDISVRAHRNLEENKINMKVIQTLSFENKQQLMLLAEKGIDINILIEEMLEKRKQKIDEEKEKIAKEILSENNTQNTQLSRGGQNGRKEIGSANKTTGYSVHNKSRQTDHILQSKPASRYIPAHIKKIVRLEHGVKCSIPYCDKPANTIHHTQRFALSQNHDPKFLAPLCREHHQLAHAVDRTYCGMRGG